MLDFGSITVFLIFVCIVVFCRYAARNNYVFKGMPFPCLKPQFFFGNTIGINFATEKVNDFVSNLYHKYSDAKLVGLFDMSSPLLFIRDPELIKKITVKDFDHFVNHEQLIELEDPGKSLVSNSLFFLKGKKWRDMRTSLSPVFTGSKLRLMFGFIDECADNFIEYVNNKNNPLLDTKLTFSRYANDVIGTTAFGLNINSFKNPDNEFFTTGQKLTDFGSLTFLLKATFFKIAPRLMEKLGIDILHSDSLNFFKAIMLETFNTRDKHHIVRPDVVNVLLELRKNGTIKQDESEKKKTGSLSGEEIDAGKQKIIRKWIDEELIAQSLVFFVAGFDTVSTCLAFLTYELALNLEVQHKLYEEIVEANEHLDGRSLSYETITKMKYMDMVVNEALRRWPPAPDTDRICNKDYICDDGEGMKFTINKGFTIWLPIYEIQNDPKYFPDPEKFDPERFSEVNRKNIDLSCYLPFGSGPRLCIGSRLALLETKVLIYKLLLNFTLEVCEETPIPMVLSNSLGGLVPERPIILGIKKRD